MKGVARTTLRLERHRAVEGHRHLLRREGEPRTCRPGRHVVLVLAPCRLVRPSFRQDRGSSSEPGRRADGTVAIDTGRGDVRLSSTRCILAGRQGPLESR